MSSLFRKLSAVAVMVVLALSLTTVRAADDDDEADPYYEGFFAAHVLSLTQANLAVGVLGDAVAKGVYEGEQAVNVAGVHSTLMEASQKVILDIAAAKGIDKEDAALLKKMAKVAGLIKDQADAIVGLAKGDQAAAPAFGKAREATQKSLDAVVKEVSTYFEE